MTERLLRVSAPHFVAGAVWHGKECVRAAPILRWMVGSYQHDAGKLTKLKAYLDKKGWAYEWL